MTALHDANRGEVVAHETLSRRWVYFWRDDRRKIGSPFMSDKVKILKYFF